MKKKLLILGLLGVVPFMTACGSKENKLSCSRELADGGVVRSFTFKFDSDDKLEGIDFQEKIDLTLVKDIKTLGCGDTIKECMKAVNSEYDECVKDESYENCKKSSESDSGLTIDASISEKGLTEGEIASIKKGMTKEEVETKAKDSLGLTCK